MFKSIRALTAICAALAAIVAAPAALAQATTYTLNASGPFTTIDNSSATPCDIPPCSTFAFTDRITGSFTRSTPLAPNLTNSFIQISSLTSYSFSSGPITHASTDPNSRLVTVFVSTNGSGAITNFSIQSLRWNILPHSLANDAAGRFSEILFGPSQQSTSHNYWCSILGNTPSGSSDQCQSASQSNDFTEASSSANGNTITVVAPPAPVPTLSEWAMILMGLTLAGSAAVVIQRRRLPA